MAFKLVSKNNIGIFTTLILVVLLSQSNLFDFLIDTPLGRITLLAFVIFIAYANQILGLIAVLCIIIAFNNNVNIVSGYNLYEGLKIRTPGVGTSRNTSNQPSQSEQGRREEEAQRMEEEKRRREEEELRKAEEEEEERRRTTTRNQAREGFCMADREINMLRGKQSNTISVSNNLREQSDDVSPSDKSVFTSDYETF